MQELENRRLMYDVVFLLNEACHRSLSLSLSLLFLPRIPCSILRPHDRRCCSGGLCAGLWQKIWYVFCEIKQAPSLHTPAPLTYGHAQNFPLYSMPTRIFSLLLSKATLIFHSALGQPQLSQEPVCVPLCLCVFCFFYIHSMLNSCW